MYPYSSWLFTSIGKIKTNYCRKDCCLFCNKRKKCSFCYNIFNFILCKESPSGNVLFFMQCQLCSTFQANQDILTDFSTLDFLGSLKFQKIRSTILFILNNISMLTEFQLATISPVHYLILIIFNLLRYIIISRMGNRSE